MAGRSRAIGCRVAALGLAVAIGSAVAVAELSGGAPAKVEQVRAVVSGPAPAFRLPALGRPGTVALPAAGEPVVLSFFASWCDGCQAEMGTMSRLAGRAAGRVHFIGIDVSDDPSAARALLARNHVTYPVGTDGGYRTAQTYRLVGLPTTVYLDARDRVVGSTVGPLTAPVGDAWLATLEAGRI